MNGASLAVELGHGSVRLATACGVTVRPSARCDDDSGVLVSALGDAHPAQLVVVHPTDWAPSRVRRLRQAAGGLADVVRTVPAALAARAGLERGSAEEGRLAVLRVGSDRADAVVLGGPGEPAVLASQGARVGGDDLDQAVSGLVQIRLPAGCLSRWHELVDGVEPADTPGRRALRAELRRGREVLSVSDEVRLRFDDPPVGVTLSRAELRPLLTRELGRLVELLGTVVAESVGSPGTELEFAL